jgi:hypothetical protein
MDYNAFITVAFTHGIPAEPLRVVQTWVEKEMACYHDAGDRIMPNWDMGFAELGDITTAEQGFQRLKHCCWMWQLEGARKYKKWLKNPDREGKGFYRWVLKTYYLCQ